MTIHRSIQAYALSQVWRRPRRSPVPPPFPDQDALPPKAPGAPPSPPMRKCIARQIAWRIAEAARSIQEGKGGEDFHRAQAIIDAAYELLLETRRAGGEGE